MGPLERPNGRVGGGVEDDRVRPGEGRADGEPAAGADRVEFLVQLGDRGTVRRELHRGVGRDAGAWLRRGITGAEPGNGAHRAVGLQDSAGCLHVELRPRGDVERPGRRHAVGRLELPHRELCPRAELGVDLEFGRRSEDVQLLLGDADLLVDVAQSEDRPGGGRRRGDDLARRDEPGDGGVPRRPLELQEPDRRPGDGGRRSAVRPLRTGRHALDAHRSLRPSPRLRTQPRRRSILAAHPGRPPE